MSVAVLLALAAGACAAGAVVELARSAPRPTRRRRPLVRLLAALGRRVGVPRPAADLAERIDAAGAPLGLAASDVVAIKGGAAAVAPLAAMPVALAMPGRLPLVMLGIAAAAGWLAPDLWLRRRARTRARVMEAELPDVLDLLRVAVGAGFGPWRALAEVGRRHPGVLVAELGATARRVALGVPAETALARLERRCPAAGTHALTDALRRADRLGAPPGRALASLAEEARARQARRAVERAARAAPKIQLVVALLLVPSALLLVAAALLPALSGASP